jgi:hypothetical protein
MRSSQVVSQLHIAGSPRGTPQLSPPRKRWETMSVKTRKPRQGRHSGFLHTKLARYPRHKSARTNLGRTGCVLYFYAELFK